MFIPLHVKSDFSLGYGTASIDELVTRAKALGYPALALTDLENLYGQIRFHEECRRHGLRPLTGLELRPGFDGRRHPGSRSGRLVLLATDRSGYRSLCRIVSLRRGASGEPESLGDDPLPLVARYPEGLFALSDDVRVVERLLVTRSFSPERLGVLLVRPDSRSADVTRQEAAERLGVRLVADLDVVFAETADHRLHLLQLAVKQGRLLSEVSRKGDGESPDRWLRGPSDTTPLFADIPQAVAAAAEIADLCRLQLGEGGDHPRPGRSAGESAMAALTRLCAETVPSVWSEAHAARLEEELATFAALGFGPFMLVVAEILARCRQSGIPVVVRGSAVSSLALHLLGGSPVDPLAHGLLFERFLHRGKKAWPDVDIDLPWERRDEVIDWVYRRYGRDRVAMVAAHHTFGYRSALREGLKACGAAPALVDRVVRALPPEDLPEVEVDFLDLAETIQDPDPAAELEAFPEAVPVREILPLVCRLVGHPRHIAVHPGGIVVGAENLAGQLPLEVAPKGVVITQYDLVAVARLGFIKIDLLGNRCLSELEEALTSAGHPRPLRLDLIPDEDAATLSLIDRAETLGCFQLESPAMRSLLSQLPIRRRSDIVAALALIRPGVAAGEVKALFVRRARGEDTAPSPFPGMEDRLRETHSLFLYEEDLMLLLSRTGGITLGEADEFRAAIVASGGDARTLARLERKYLAGATGRDPARVREAWGLATRLAAYSFNKAHAASYGLLAYYSAYAKAHYPLQFASALLNHHQGIYPLRTLVAELSRAGVRFLPPHVNSSSYRSACVDGRGVEGVRVGLDKVKSLSRRSAALLLAERDARGAFQNFADFLARLPLSLREITSLVLAGACDGLSPLAAADYPFAHETVLARLRGGPGAEGERLLIEPAASPDDVALYRRLVRVRNELAYLGMAFLAHPMAVLRPEAARYRCLPIDSARRARAGATVRCAVVVAAMRRTMVAGGVLLFLTLEDETGLLEGVVLPKIYRSVAGVVTTPGPFLVEGKLRLRHGGVHLEIGRLVPFHQRRRPYGSP